MKGTLFGLIAAAAMMFAPTAAQAGHGHGSNHGGWGGHGGWHSGYHGGWGGYHHHHHHHGYYRPPVIVQRPCVNPYFYGPSTSFFYSGRNAAFGFGF